MKKSIIAALLLSTASSGAFALDNASASFNGLSASYDGYREWQAQPIALNLAEIVRPGSCQGGFFNTKVEESVLRNEQVYVLEFNNSSKRVYFDMSRVSDAVNSCIMSDKNTVKALNRNLHEFQNSESRLAAKAAADKAAQEELEKEQAEFDRMVDIKTNKHFGQFMGWSSLCDGGNRMAHKDAFEVKDVLTAKLTKLGEYNESAFMEAYNAQRAEFDGTIAKILDAKKAGIKDARKWERNWNSLVTDQCYKIRSVRREILRRDAEAKFNEKWGH
ncbi:hypothetical protein VPHD479_0059 [Vibrio phage D479]